jgi:ABC-type transport system involved in multi-copper enzyme maturation permease subunit
MNLDTKSVYTVAKKEFTDHIRNRWILILIIVFIALTLVASFLAGQQSLSSDKTLGGAEDTVVTLLSIAGFLMPLIAIMLGFSTIAGEAESGSLALVLSYPIRRSEVLLGKFLGLGAILAFTTLIGFGIGGIIISISAGTAQILGFLAFIGLTILFGLMYLGPMILFSALLKRRVTAIGSGIFMFLWSPIYSMITFGIYLATTNISPLDLMQGGTISLPNWMWWSISVSPTDLYETTVMKAFNVQQAFGFQMPLPGFLATPVLLFFMCLWIAIPLLLAYVFFRRRDI